MMTPLIIQYHPGASSDLCAFCGKPASACAGPQLCLADSLEVVCRDCGKKRAPSLVALVDLARAAERVGRIGRHTVCPPLSALLELARAAENYTHTAPRRARQAV
jgi:hypothetical protein